jgi:hypothetical protein
MMEQREHTVALLLAHGLIAVRQQMLRLLSGFAIQLTCCTVLLASPEARPLLRGC